MGGRNEWGNGNFVDDLLTLPYLMYELAVGPQKITTPLVVPGSAKHQAILTTEFYSQTPGDTFYEIFCLENFRVWTSFSIFLIGRLSAFDFYFVEL